MVISQNEFNVAAINEYHVACVLLVDTSGSMMGQAIDNLNRGISEFKENSMLDELARKRVDVAIVEFNTGARIVQDFVPLPNMVLPTLEANGNTSMGEGLELAIKMIEQRKSVYKEVGTPYYRPWIFLITDGMPTDDYMTAADHIREMAEKKKLVCWAVGVPGYSTEALKNITERVIELNNVDFPTIFEWLSNSLIRVSGADGKKIEYSDLPHNARIIPKDWD